MNPWWSPKNYLWCFHLCLLILLMCWIWIKHLSRFIIGGLLCSRCLRSFDLGCQLLLLKPFLNNQISHLKKWLKHFSHKLVQSDFHQTKNQLLMLNLQSFLLIYLINYFLLGCWLKALKPDILQDNLHQLIILNYIMQWKINHFF